VQTNIECTILKPQPLIVPFHGHSIDPRHPRTQPVSVGPASELLRARREALQAQAFELIAWLGMILSALGVVVLSFWS